MITNEKQLFVIVHNSFVSGIIAKTHQLNYAGGVSGATKPGV